MILNFYFYGSLFLLLFIIYYDILSIRTSCYQIIQYTLYKMSMSIIDINSLAPKSTDFDLYNLLNLNIKLPDIKNPDIIPNRLFQTYYNKDKIPNYIFNNYNLYASNYDYTIFDDKEAIDFLNKY